jgi:hypothetical protein
MPREPLTAAARRSLAVQLIDGSLAINHDIDEEK